MERKAARRLRRIKDELWDNDLFFYTTTFHKLKNEDSLGGSWRESEDYCPNFEEEDPDDTITTQELMEKFQSANTDN